ncbi:MAG: sigma-70 family RNA polymerase sigma factor [Solirubrobacteraceae bacterium]
MKAAAVLSGRSNGRRAEALAYAELHRLERPVLAVVDSRLRAEKISLPYPDLEAAYNQAWHGVCQTLAEGEEVRSLKSLLVKITYCRAIDADRRGRNEMPASTTFLEQYADGADLLEQVNDHVRLERMIAAVCKRLTARERIAVGLCALHGYSRREAAQLLGVREVRLRKIMESASKKIASIVANIDARGCGDEEWAGALRAFALSAEDQHAPNHIRIAVHIEDCATCRRYVTALRGLAAALPPPLMLPFGAGHSSVLAWLHRQSRSRSGMHLAEKITRGSKAVAQRAGTSAPASSGSPVAGVLGGGVVKALAVGLTAVLTVASGGVVVSEMDAHASRVRHVTASALHASLLYPGSSAAGRSSNLKAHKRNQTRKHKPSRTTIDARRATVPGERHAAMAVRGGPISTSSAVATGNAPTTSSGRPQPASHGESQTGEFGFERSNGR